MRLLPDPPRAGDPPASPLARAPRGRLATLAGLTLLLDASAWSGLARSQAAPALPSGRGRGNDASDAPRPAAERAAALALAHSPALDRPFAAPRERWTDAPLRAQATYVVTTAADTGSGTLRAAITQANIGGVPATISFSIGGGVQTITPVAQLPEILVPVTIDGTTQTGGTTPGIVISGASAGANANGLMLKGGHSTVRGLAIGGFASTGTAGIGLVLETAGGNVVQGNYFGTDAGGTALRVNASDGIVVRAGSGGNLIGGTTAAARNVIGGALLAGITVAIDAAPGNVISGNYIGLNAAGTAALAQGGNGIFVDSADDTIGGTVAGARNVISGNALPAVFIGMDATRVVVQGNWFGTDAGGTYGVANSGNGVYIDRSPNNLVGSTNALGRNVFGEDHNPGVYIYGAAATGNTVEGNYVGTNAAGTAALSFGNGIIVDGANGNRIGVAVAGGGNLVSGNPSPAIDLIDGASGNAILGNVVGLDPTGAFAVPNIKGILVNASPSNVIGGTTAAERNVVSGNTSYGIEVRSAGASGTRITGNYIGTDFTGELDRGNGQHGIIVGSSQDTIGDLAPGAGNRIAFNKGVGVYDSTGSGVRILSNDMSGNAGLGIDLYPRGITPNDSLDLDSGVNGQQNFPVVDSIQTLGTRTRLFFEFLDKPGQGYTLQFFRSDSCNASHFGEGRTLIGTMNFTAGATGADTASYFANSVWPVTQFVTATATDASGNTSEFSPCTCMSDADGDGILDTWETQGWGIDSNHDGKIDLDLWALGARPDHKDVFVEIDAMRTYAPPDSALRMVQAAFAAAPAALVHNPDGLAGVALHYTLDDTTIDIQPLPDWGTNLAALKQQWFGTATQRGDPNAKNILAAKRLVYRYGLWARTFIDSHGDSTSSGVAELTGGKGGDDFLVTLGSTPPTQGWYHTSDPRDHAGTFMHELGHTLGLQHGGADSILYKPNYVSVMNYTWQTPLHWQVPGTWSLGYSTDSLPPLDEGDLDELAGLVPTAGAYPGKFFIPFCDSTDHIRQAMPFPGLGVDWSGDGVIASRHVISNVNDLQLTKSAAGLGETLYGFEDWSHLKYDFRASPAFTALGVASAAGSSPVGLNELTSAIDATLDQLPSPRPSGTFVMDGKLDSIAVPLASNAGITLWGAYRNNQLYLATSSAQAQGADMCIFVSSSRRSLHAAPLGKSGQVGDWDAVLTNRNSDHSSDWWDDAGTSLVTMTADSAGTVLEGVVPVAGLFGQVPTHIFLAVGKYAATSGGALVAQVPAGNADANLDGSEYFDWSTTLDVGTLERPGAGRVRFEDAGREPAAGRASLRLTLPTEADARVSVLDLAGRRVAELVHGHLAAGVHSLGWDPGSAGGAAPAGVYFVVASALGERHVVRVVMLR